MSARTSDSPGLLNQTVSGRHARLAMLRPPGVLEATEHRPQRPPLLAVEVQRSRPAPIRLIEHRSDETSELGVAPFLDVGGCVL